MGKTFRAVIGALLAALACAWIPTAQAADGATAAGDLVSIGRALYLEGRRPDGSALVATRAGGLAISGAEAACANCHRRSGLGGAEGRSYIPPVTHAALSSAMPAGKGASAIGDGRPAYTPASLARALRAGVDPGGRPLDFLMPRYRLDDQEVAALQAYLAGLPGASAPGGGVVHFATVVAPGVPRERSEAMLGVLQACFDEHNAGPQAEQGRRKLADDMRQRDTRKWQLHVWSLQGAPDTWERQLAQRAGEQPVFAMVGGIGGGQWEPVHAFCEGRGLPCLFPHLEASAPAAPGFYPLYLGKGAVLEAGLVARHIAQQAAGGRAVTQVLREGDAAAQAAAAALRQSLAEHGLATRELRLQPQAALGPDSFAGIEPDAALVLWLRADDLRRLEAVRLAPPQVYVSATLAGDDAVPLPRAWKARALMAYPFELPQQRARRVAPLRQWLHARGLPQTHERVQADAYVACRALRTAMLEADDHLGPDYLVERVETDMERTTAIGLYPRLALGIGQRFASKSGYLVRFDETSGGLVAEGERIAP